MGWMVYCSLFFFKKKIERERRKKKKIKTLYQPISNSSPPFCSIPLFPNPIHSQSMKFTGSRNHTISKTNISKQVSSYAKDICTRKETFPDMWLKVYEDGRTHSPLSVYRQIRSPRQSLSFPTSLHEIGAPELYRFSPQPVSRPHALFLILPQRFISPFSTTSSFTPSITTTSPNGSQSGYPPSNSFRSLPALTMFRPLPVFL